MIVRDTELVLNFQRGDQQSGPPVELVGDESLVAALYRILTHRLTLSCMSIVALDDPAGSWQTLVRLDGDGKPLGGDSSLGGVPTKGRITPRFRELTRRFLRHALVVEDYAVTRHTGGVLLPGAQGMRSGIHAFVAQESRIVGGIFVQHVEPGMYSERDAPFVQALGQAVGVILQNLRHQKSTRDSRPTRAANLPGARAKSPAARQDGSVQIIGSSHAMQRVTEWIEQVGPTDMTVLILGETGTGKDLIARRIVEQSSRHSHPFVTVNCAALSADLVASELFGHVAGAFTGATSTRKGRFELANHGTLFLDEVGDLPWETQVRLLRVLESGEFQRVGSNVTQTTDVRILAATHRDLSRSAMDGQFRADLFYRLNVFPLHVPPLRDRGGDIAELARHFVRRSAERTGRPPPPVTDTVLDAFKRYPWVGNVRELKNVVERALILSHYAPIGLEHLPAVFATDQTVSPRRTDAGWLPLCQRGTKSPGASALVQHGDRGGREVVTLAEATRLHILKTLERCGGKVSGDGGAAQLLGINPKTLESKMRKLGIRRIWS